MRRSEGKSKKRKAKSEKQIPHAARKSAIGFGMTDLGRVSEKRKAKSEKRKAKSEKRKAKSRSLTPLAKGAIRFGMTVSAGR